MFDVLYAADGGDWQTKAFACLLDNYRIGDALVPEVELTDTFQVEVLGEPSRGSYVDSFATVLGGILVEVPAERDPSLPLLNYGGHWVDR